MKDSLKLTMIISSIVVVAIIVTIFVSSNFRDSSNSLGGVDNPNQNPSSKCYEKWSCSDWSNKTSYCGTRICSNKNPCNNLNMPEETRACLSGINSDAPVSSGNSGGGGGGSSPTPETPAPDNPPSEKPVGENYLYEVPVLILSYLPTKDNVNLDYEETKVSSTISNMREKINSINKQLTLVLSNSTSYHEYKDISATPTINYSIFEEKEFLTVIPPDTDHWNNVKPSDKFKIFENMDICNYVDNLGVKEVWIWMYHTDKVGPIESNMAMGRNIQEYWSYDNYGDVSNSYRENDLPICENTYTVYEYNYGREIPEALEDHTHQIEAVMNFVDGHVWSDLFVGDGCGQKEFYRCGWTHYPPNVMEFCTGHDYDWSNTRQVISDCEDWKPDGSGEKKMVSCETWSLTKVGQSACQNSNSSQNFGWKMWWMQSIPGKNNGLTYDGKSMRNWWEFIGDFDNALKRGKSFT